MSGSAMSRSASFDGLLFEHGLQRVDLVTAREGEEALIRRGAMGEIGFQYALDRARRLVGFDVVKNLAAALGIRPKAAADVNVVALDLIAVLVDLHLDAEQADVADVMLRAGVGAAGEMDVERAVERNAGFAPLRDVVGVLLGVGHGEPATG